MDRGRGVPAQPFLRKGWRLAGFHSKKGSSSRVHFPQRSMKTPSLLRLALLFAASLLAGCQSSQAGKKPDAWDRTVDLPSIEKTADAYRRSGAAPSMLDAQRMAENYY